MRSSINLFLAAVILVSSTELVAQNRLVNPGFDGNLDGWNFISDSEQSVDFDPRDANGNAMSGSVRQRFLAPTIPNRRLASIGQAFSVVPGSTYSFGGKYRNDNGQGTVALVPPAIGIFWRDSEGTILAEPRSVVDGTLAEGVWLSLTGSGVAPPNAVSGIIFLFTPSQTNVQTLFDDLFVAGASPDPCASLELRDAAFDYRGSTTNCAPGALSCVSGEPIRFIPELIFDGPRTCLDAVAGLSTFRWNFGDGSSSTERNPVKSFSGAGPFTVTLSVSHPSGERQASQQLDFAPRVVITEFPDAIVGSSSGGNSTTYTLRNIGGSPTTINLSRQGNFFSQSPESFTLAPGAFQQITVTALAVTGTFNAGTSNPSGPGVPSGSFVPIVVVGIPAPAGSVVGTPMNSRIDIRATSGSSMVQGFASFSNSGSANLTGILASNVPWLIPQQGLVTIPPGGTTNVSFTVDGRLRPDSGDIGTFVAKLFLVYRLGTSQLGKHPDPESPFNTTGSAAAAAAVVHTVTPGTSVGAAEPLQPGEIAVFIPGIAHVLGSVGTFISDVTLTSLLKAGTIPNLRMFFRTAGIGGTSSTTSPINVMANRPLSFGDIAQTVFGNTTSVGSLQVRGGAASSVAATANVFISDNPDGTFGTTIPSFRSDRSTGANGTIFLTGLTSSATTHTNLYIQEASGLPAAVTIEFFNPQGVLVLSRSEAVDGFGLLSLGTSVPAGAVSARITTSADSTGTILAYATPVDRASDDTWAVVDWPKQYGYDPTSPVIIPVVGALRGANNTFFRTDAAFLNSGTTAGSGTARFFSRTGATIDRNISLQAGQSMIINDILTNLFGLTSDDVGYIVFTPTSGSFVLTSRTYTTVVGDVATFGTGVPTLALDSGIQMGESVRFGGITDAALSTVMAELPATYRTNAGLVETAGHPVTVRATLRFTSGNQNTASQAIASKDYPLGPREFKQLNRIAEEILGAATRNTLGDLSNMQLDFEVIDGAGAVVIFTSTLDNGTGDSTLRVD